MPRLAKAEKTPTDAQLAARAAGAERLRKAAAARKAGVLPVRSTRNDLETQEQKIGQDVPRLMSSTGPAIDSLEPPQIEPVDRPVSKNKLEILKFMEEPVTILVHDSTNPTDEPVPYVINGGMRQAFFRGQEQTVKRKYVEVLARMKRTIYTQRRYKDSQGIDCVQQVPHTALAVPFNVVEDTAEGKAWLKRVLAEA